MASTSATPALDANFGGYSYDGRTMSVHHNGQCSGGGPACEPRYLPGPFLPCDQNNLLHASSMNAAHTAPGHPITHVFPPNVLRFEPLEPPSNFTQTHTTTAPTKMESPTLPTPTVLTLDVDASLYHHIAMDEWMKAPPEYTTSPSSAADSPDTLPQTPQWPRLHNWPEDGPRKDSFMDDFVLELAGAMLPHEFDAAVKNLYPQSPVSSWQVPHGLPFVPELETVTQYISPGQIEMHQGPPAVAASFSTETEETGSVDPDNSESDYASDSASRASSVSSQGQGINVPALPDRRDRDQFLLDMRKRGFTYKQIKLEGKFVEAESTLRGRVRTLTKEKCQRVRKPQWQKRDVKLLRRAVKHFEGERSASGHGGRRASKIPWKKVSQYMLDQESSYEFAPATCAKKWDEVS